MIITGSRSVSPLVEQRAGINRQPHLKAKRGAKKEHGIPGLLWGRGGGGQGDGERGVGRGGIFRLVDDQAPHTREQAENRIYLET